MHVLLEWATHTPVPEYNFAITPQVNSSQAFWDAKKKRHVLFPGKYEEIHMPNNSGLPFIMSCYLLCMGILICICDLASCYYFNNWNLCLYGLSFI